MKLSSPALGFKLKDNETDIYTVTTGCNRDNCDFFRGYKEALL